MTRKQEIAALREEIAALRAELALRTRWAYQPWPQPQPQTYSIGSACDPNIWLRNVASADGAK